MCGLSGIVITQPKLIPMELVKTIFSLLMEENDDRGGHSWGAWGSKMAPVRGLGKYSTNRAPLHAWLKDFRFVEKGPTFLFGHTRYGTHGSRTIENSHPFVEGNITLAHNGVVDVEGYTTEDHAVDSARIAIALTQKGYVGGMACVMGMCSLLLSVDGQPLVYRHDQVLNYAQFPWGSAISSTFMDLELTVVKRLGLEPVGGVLSVPENTFCQPGFGLINVPAPGKERPKYVPPEPRRKTWYGGISTDEDDDRFSGSRHDMRSDDYGGGMWKPGYVWSMRHGRYVPQEEADSTTIINSGWSNRTWDRDKQCWVYPERVQATLGLVTIDKATVTGGGQEFSGKSDLPEAKVTTELKSIRAIRAEVKAKAKREAKERKAKVAAVKAEAEAILARAKAWIEAGERAKANDYKPPPWHPTEDDEPMFECARCGYPCAIEDVSICCPNWSAGIEVPMCLDCIMDEVVTQGEIVVLRPYNAPTVTAMDDFGNALDVLEAEVVEADPDTPPDNIDELNAKAKEELEEYITRNYGEPRHV